MTHQGFRALEAARMVLSEATGLTRSADTVGSAYVRECVLKTQEMREVTARQSTRQYASLSFEGRAGHAGAAGASLTVHTHLALLVRRREMSSVLAKSQEDGRSEALERVRWRFGCQPLLRRPAAFGRTASPVRLFRSDILTY